MDEEVKWKRRERRERPQAGARKPIFPMRRARKEEAREAGANAAANDWQRRTPSSPARCAPLKRVKNVSCAASRIDVGYHRGRTPMRWPIHLQKCMSDSISRA